MKSKKQEFDDLLKKFDNETVFNPVKMQATRINSLEFVLRLYSTDKSFLEAGYAIFGGCTKNFSLGNSQESVIEFRTLALTRCALLGTVVNDARESRYVGGYDHSGGGKRLK